jgi:hypothetical protein
MPDREPATVAEPTTAQILVPVCGQSSTGSKPMVPLGLSRN